MPTVSEFTSAASSTNLEKPRGKVRFRHDRHRLPAELLADPRFLTWRYETVEGKATKVPYTPDGRKKADKRRDFGPFEACVKTVCAASDQGVGIGFALGEPWVGLDFDMVLDETGNPSEEFRQLLEPLHGIGCYAEISPSGTGVKFLVRADAAKVRAIAADIAGKRPTTESNKFRPCLPGIQEVQVFHGGGYFALTGEPWGRNEWNGLGWDDATEVVGAVMRLANEMKFRKPATERHKAPIRLVADLADEEVLDRAFAARNGEEVKALYDGGNGKHGAAGTSEADCALAAHLAFYCGPNGQDQVIRLMRGSGRNREKFAREDYMTDTVAKGYHGLTEFYEPARRRTEPAATSAPAASRRTRKADAAVHEFALADAFRREHHGKLFRTNQERWFQRDEASGVFREDSRGTVLGTAIDTVRMVMANPIYDETTKARCSRVAVASAVLRAAGAYGMESGGLAVEHKELDRDPWLLGTPAGVLDLRTGTVRMGTPADLVTKMVRVAPAARANDESCPYWLEFLRSAAGDDPDTISFLRRWAGYALTGDLSEHAVLWLYGPGGTGKSTFIEALAWVLGEYATTMSAQVLLSDDQSHPTAVASLHGARLAACSEFPEGKPLNEARLKRLSGEDEIRARFMRQDEFSFRMTAKMVAATNHRPRLLDVSDAMARRLHVVEFMHKPSAVDTALRSRLRDEAPGILRWMLDGLAELLENRASRGGLNPPVSVRNATADYLDSQDTLREWWDACFRYTGDRGTFMATREILAKWNEWAQANNIRDNLTGNQLAEFMQLRFNTKAVNTSWQGAAKARGYFGVAVAAVDRDGCSD